MRLPGGDGALAAAVFAAVLAAYLPTVQRGVPGGDSGELLAEACALDVSADGALLASSSKDCTARVWGVESGACVAVCDGHVEAVGGLAFARRSAALLPSGQHG
jgi:WD40 repeat protein